MTVANTIILTSTRMDKSQKMRWSKTMKECTSLSTSPRTVHSPWALLALLCSHSPCSEETYIEFKDRLKKAVRQEQIALT